VAKAVAKGAFNAYAEKTNSDLDAMAIQCLYLTPFVRNP